MKKLARSRHRVQKAMLWHVITFVGMNAHSLIKFGLSGVLCQPLYCVYLSQVTASNLLYILYSYLVCTELSLSFFSYSHFTLFEYLVGLSLSLSLADSCCVREKSGGSSTCLCYANTNQWEFCERKKQKRFVFYVYFWGAGCLGKSMTACQWFHAALPPPLHLHAMAAGRVMCSSQGRSELDSP